MMEFIMSFPVWFWMVVIAFILLSSFYLLNKAKKIKTNILGKSVEIDMDESEEEKPVEKSTEEKIVESVDKNE